MLAQTIFIRRIFKMNTDNYYKDVTHVVSISTDIKINCEHCNTMVGGENFADSINHYIENHGYKILHIGTETSHKDENLWHDTVALLGK